MPDDTKDNGTQRRDGRDFGGHGRAMTNEEKDKVAKKTGGLLGKAMSAARKRKALLDSI